MARSRCVRSAAVSAPALGRGQDPRQPPDGAHQRDTLAGTRPLPPRVATSLGRVSGVEVVEVVDGSPAAQAGLRPEDLIVELNGTPVESVDDIQRLMVGELIGSRVHARVLREGSETELDLVPGELVS